MDRLKIRLLWWDLTAPSCQLRWVAPTKLVMKGASTLKTGPSHTKALVRSQKEGEKKQGKKMEE